MDKKAIALYKMCEDSKFFGNILEKFSQSITHQKLFFQKKYQIIKKKLNMNAD
jgi:hypothetical protein